MANTSTPDWGDLLIGQLAFYWDNHLRPRLDGLTDEEYFWEPVPGCWTVRPDEHGNYRLDDAPGADPAPVTTVAWRMMHIAVGCFVTRSSTFFGDGSVGPDADMFDPRPYRRICRTPRRKVSRSWTTVTERGTGTFPNSARPD